MNYSYPFDISWTKQEIIDVINFFTLIERAYEKTVNQDEVLLAYRLFKQVVPAKSEEKKLCLQFERESGYSAYHVVKRAKESTNKQLKM